MPRSADQLAPYRFQPGKSGNPGGPPAAYRAFKALCRERTKEAALRMFELAELNSRTVDGQLAPISAKADLRIVYMASQWVIEQGWGKPKDFDPSKEVDAGKPKFDPRLLSAEQLQIVRYALGLMSQASRAASEVTGETVIEPSEESAAAEDAEDVTLQEDVTLREDGDGV